MADYYAPLQQMRFTIEHLVGFDEVKARLLGAGYTPGQNVVADFKIKQLYIDDPDGVKIELNFVGE